MWRKRLLRGGAGFALIALAFLVWGVVIEPRRISVENHELGVHWLPQELEGERLALIADFQIGMWMGNTGTVRRIVQRLVEDRPAAVLIAGDFLYDYHEKVDEDIALAVQLVSPLPAAGIPVFAVLGNHDYSLNLKDDPKNTEMAESLRSALEAAGIRVLMNEAAPVPTNGASSARNSLYIVGVGSHWADEDDPVAAIRQVPDSSPYIVLMHNPSSFLDIPAGLAPLSFGAHTHGGQVRLPFSPQWSWLTFVEEDPVHSDGWTDEDFGEPGNRLYVNRGIGFSEFPIRINSPPEITYFTLVRR
jgi:uncharacterized protein